MTLLAVALGLMAGVIMTAPARRRLRRFRLRRLMLRRLQEFPI